MPLKCKHELLIILINTNKTFIIFFKYKTILFYSLYRTLQMMKWNKPGVCRRFEPGLYPSPFTTKVYLGTLSYRSLVQVISYLHRSRAYEVRSQFSQKLSYKRTVERNLSNLLKGFFRL